MTPSERREPSISFAKNTPSVGGQMTDLLTVRRSRGRLNRRKMHLALSLPAFGRLRKLPS
jgi:hypothetical protein